MGTPRESQFLPRFIAKNDLDGGNFYQDSVQKTI
jgi:hypothetical protein